MNKPAPKPWTQTFTGHQFFGLAPRTRDIFIEDIAHALALVNRYNGHTPLPYSVAQHSVLVSKHCDPQDAFWGLMHDASEAYICDLVAPVKHGMPQYKEVEARLMVAICKRFKMPLKEPDSVKRADMMVLAAEARDMFPVRPADWNLPLPPVSTRVRPMHWRKAEKMFLERFYELRK